MISDVGDRLPTDGDLRDRARDYFGQDLVHCYDEWLRIAQQIINGQKNPRGLPQDVEIERWAETIDPRDRPSVLALCAKVTTGALFCLMNLLDGSQASYLPKGSRYRLVAEIPVPEADATGRNATLSVDLTSPDQLVDLHEDLYRWIRRFSHFGEQPSGEG